MVLTEEEKIDGYPELSFEGTTGQPEVQLQDGYWEDKTGASINVAAVRTARPGGFGTSGTNGTYVSSIKKSQGAIGAAKLLKVMAATASTPVLTITTLLQIPATAEPVASPVCLPTLPRPLWAALQPEAF